MREQKPQLVIVDWGDAWATSGWMSEGHLNKEHKELPVRIVGFLFKSDKRGITITQGFDETGAPLGAQFVPKGMIRKIKKVRY